MKICFFAWSALFALTLAGDGCNKDNVLRCLIGRDSAVATPYCSSLLELGVTKTVTSVPLASTTATFLQTSISTTITTLITTTITTIALGQSQNTVVERQLAPPVSPFPQCLGKSSTLTYPISRIYSACSCLSLPKTTISITSTAPTSTATISSSITILTTTTETSQIVATSTSIAGPLQCNPIRRSRKDNLIPSDFFSNLSFQQSANTALCISQCQARAGCKSFAVYYGNGVFDYGLGGPNTYRFAYCELYPSPAVEVEGAPGGSGTFLIGGWFFDLGCTDEQIQLLIPPSLFIGS